LEVGLDLDDGGRGGIVLIILFHGL